MAQSRLACRVEREAAEHHPLRDGAGIAGTGDAERWKSQAAEDHAVGQPGIER